MTDVTMPQLGESVTTGTIVRWMKQVGDAVAVDEPLFEVNTDKVAMEIPALVAGRLEEIVAGDGEQVPVGAVVARIATAIPVPVPAAGAAARAAAAGNGARSYPRRTGREALSPVVRRLAREHRLDLGRVSGSGGKGRITKGDVLAHLAALAPSPPAGRSEPLAPQRRTLVARLQSAQKSAVNVFSAIEIDMERVAEARRARGLTYLPFVASAVVEALRAYPALNASFDAEHEAIVHHDAVHLGIAVDLDEKGLVVPVVRDAQNLSVQGLAREIARLADGARSQTLGPDAYAGSTFSITNNGAFGTLLTAPVINPPNVAIVSTDAVEDRPVVIDRMIAIRRRMYFCMTWDHRAFDGSTAGRFLAHVKRVLETRDWTV